MTIVLLHGAGTGAWVWDRLIGELETPALALEYPGRTAGATPASCADALVRDLDEGNTGDVMVVMHSLAGVLARELAQRLAGRLKKCVFVSAMVPPPGGAFVDALGFVERSILRVLFRLNPDGLKPSAAMIRKQLCNDLGPEDTERVIARYEAELPGLYLQSAGDRDIGCDSTYVKLLADRSVSPRRQDAMIARLDGVRVRTLDAGHLAMLSSPRELAELLDQEAETARTRAPEPTKKLAARLDTVDD